MPPCSSRCLLETPTPTMPKDFDLLSQDFVAFRYQDLILPSVCNPHDARLKVTARSQILAPCCHPSFRTTSPNKSRIGEMSQMNDNEMAIGGDLVIRWRDRTEGRLMRAELEPAVPSTVLPLRRRLVAQR
jgi:hypothetical protein